MGWLRGFGSIPVCLLASASLHAAAAELPDYFPPGVRVLMGLRVPGLLAALAQQDFAKQTQETVSTALAQTAIPGLDPFHDVDEILLGSTGEGANPPSLVIVKGRFKAEAFSSAGARDGNTLMVGGPASRQAVAFVDANTLLAGDPALVRAALARGPDSASIEPALAARAAGLRARYDIWAAGDLPAGAKMPAGAGQLESIDSFDIGVALAHGLECSADLHVRSPQDMEKLNASLQLLEAALKMQTAGPGEGRFNLHTENSSIHVSVSIPEEALKKAIAAQRAALASAAAGRPAAAPPKPEPPHTTVVKDSAGNTVIVTLPGKR
jgi:hypothetical protein